MAVAAIYIVPVRVDNRALENYRARVLQNLSDLEALETVSGCGNIAGSSNSTSLYVGVLAKLPEGAEIPRDPCVDSAEAEQSWEMNMLGLHFDALEGLEHPEEYSILGYSEDAPCGLWDIRGH